MNLFQMILQDTILNQLSDGQYMFFYENNIEFHYFTITLDNQMVHIIQTYGGINHLIKKDVNKQEWVKYFIQIMGGNSGAYHSGLGLPKPNASARDFNLRYRRLI